MFAFSYTPSWVTAACLVRKKFRASSLSAAYVEFVAAAVAVAVGLAARRPNALARKICRFADQPFLRINEVARTVGA